MSKSTAAVSEYGQHRNKLTQVMVTRLADITRLTAVYCAWKIFLLVIVALSPGPGYDTSTRSLFDQYGPAPSGGAARVLYELALRLTRWDGIYFSSASVDGYKHEQQWAFSWVQTRMSSLLVDGAYPHCETHSKAKLFSVLLLPQSLPAIARHALAASIISLVSHLGAVILLYLFVVAILPSPLTRRTQIALTAAYLHIFSPAGVFLIAPYAEATFALLNIGGMLSYACSVQSKDSTWKYASLAVLTGALFGLASTIRSNGLLSGIVFAWDALGPAFNILFGDTSIANLRRLIIPVLAGSLVAIGYAIPQYIAYQEYCNSTIERPWCSDIPPSIYNWVQRHYWDVDLFKYWTLSNLPLFALATPVLWLLLNTGYGALHHGRSLLIAINGEERPSLSSRPDYQADRLAFIHVFERLAAPQIVLAILAATSFHVQIINRISSGYPIWYIVLAIAIDDQSPKLECGHSRSEHYYPFRQLRGRLPRLTVQGFVLYAVVQAGLFSSFLPPA